MMYLIIILICSFFLESVCSLFITIHSYLLPLFTLVSFIMIYPYLRKYDNPIYKICFVTGLCYDIVYTNTVFLHIISFSLIAYILFFLYRFFEYKYLNMILMIIISIILYRLVGFFLVLVIGEVAFSIPMLLHGVFGSLLINCIYGSILYIILNYLKKSGKIYFYH